MPGSSAAALAAVLPVLNQDNGMIRMVRSPWGDPLTAIATPVSSLVHTEIIFSTHVPQVYVPYWQLPIFDWFIHLKVGQFDPVAIAIRGHEYPDRIRQIETRIAAQR